MNKLKINTIEGETVPARRRRTAVAITELLERDTLLCDEVAKVLDIDPKVLNWRVEIATPTVEEFVDL
jgi:hypothetical protein